MRPVIHLAVVGSIIMLSACKSADTNATDQAKPTLAPPILSDEVVEQTDLPMKEEFEEAAYAAIDEDNLDSQVDDLQREILADKQ